MKVLLIILFLFFSTTLNSQNYLLGFTASGSSSTVTSVKVENLTNGSTVTINGDDVLRLNVVVGSEPLLLENTSHLSIFPNPLTEFSYLEFYPPKEGESELNVTDITGRIVISISFRHGLEKERFLISNLKRGIYVVSVVGDKFHYSARLISNSTTEGKTSVQRVLCSVREKLFSVNSDRKSIQGIVDMDYKSGERLKLTGISSSYKAVVMCSPTEDMIMDFNFVPCTDGSGNSYEVVQIGCQKWMAENLKTIKYSNGDLIPSTTANLEFSGEVSPKYQWAYNGNESNASVYGRLYTWYVATDSRNVCPDGWHIPNDTEWNSLLTYSGGTSIAGGVLKETGTIHWSAPNLGAKNDLGFSGLPGGYRTYMGSEIYTFLIHRSFIWSYNEKNSESANNLSLQWDSESGSLGSSYKKAGNSIRCIKD
jgi:uncharacterized protein (TIGR02145 family)